LRSHTAIKNDLYSRQNLPQLAGSSVEKTLKGAYVLQEPSSKAHLILVATGSEVSLAVDSASLLAKENVHVRLFSCEKKKVMNEKRN
jgi:transketolase